jgi:hypothetical protein
MNPQNLRDWATLAVATYSAILFVVLLVTVFFIQDPTLRHDLYMIIVASVALNFNTAVGYYMGSSKGSDKKDDTIAKTVPPASHP